MCPVASRTCSSDVTTGLSVIWHQIRLGLARLPPCTGRRTCQILASAAAATRGRSTPTRGASGAIRDQDRGSPSARDDNVTQPIGQTLSESPLAALAAA